MIKYKANYALCIGTIISAYILFAMVFPEMQIQFSLLSAEATQAFNRIIEALAISYLMGVFVYYLTVILKNKNDRSRRKWELNAIVKESNYLENIQGRDKWPLFNKESYKELTPDEVSKLNKQYYEFVQRLHLYDAILTEDELDNLSIISTNIDFEPYNEFMDSEQITFNVEKIKAICKAVEKIKNSIIKEIQATK